MGTGTGTGPREGAEGAEVGLAATQVAHDREQQVGLLVGWGEPPQQVRSSLSLATPRAKALLARGAAVRLPPGKVAVALGDRDPGGSRRSTSTIRSVKRQGVLPDLEDRRRWVRGGTGV